MWLGLKKDGERLSCIKDCERYLVLIIVANYVYASLGKLGCFKNYWAVKRGFLKPQKPPLYTPLTVYEIYSLR